MVNQESGDCGVFGGSFKHRVLTGKKSLSLAKRESSKSKVFIKELSRFTCRTCVPKGASILFLTLLVSYWLSNRTT